MRALECCFVWCCYWCLSTCSGIRDFVSTVVLKHGAGWPNWRTPARSILSTSPGLEGVSCTVSRSPLCSLCTASLADLFSLNPSRVLHRGFVVACGRHPSWMAKIHFVQNTTTQNYFCKQSVISQLQPFNNYFGTKHTTLELYHKI